MSNLAGIAGATNGQCGTKFSEMSPWVAYPFVCLLVILLVVMFLIGLAAVIDLWRDR